MSTPPDHSLRSRSGGDPKDMTDYLIRGARILDGEPTEVLIRDGVIARIGGFETLAGARSSTT